MIYLIGGSPRSGKSLLAEKLAKKLNISWFSTDYFRAVVMHTYPKKELSTAFPGEYAFQKMEENNDFFFNLFTPAQCLKFDLDDAKTLWPGIKVFLEWISDQKQDFILEGVHLLPKHLSTLRKEKYWKEIKITYLVKTDIPAMVSGFEKYCKIKGDKVDWLVDNCADPETLQRAARVFTHYGKHIQKQAQKYKFKCVSSDKHFNQVQQKLLKQLKG